MVVFASSGLKSSAMLGRLSCPAFRLRSHSGDSGSNGRMRISGMAGMMPEISV